MFPIYDERGDAVGFGGRALGDERPEVQELAGDADLPEEPVALRPQLGEGRGRRAGSRSIICEGYTDVMAFALAGVAQSRSPRAAPRSPTTTSRSSRTSRARSSLAYDSDAAGQSAAEKWYGWEQRYEIQLEVADLPGGQGSRRRVARRPGRAPRGASNARTPFLAVPPRPACWRPPTSATLEGRARGAEAGADIVAEHPSDLVRDQYVMKLAGELDIDADRLRDTVARHRKEQAAGGSRGPRRGRRRRTRRAADRAVVRVARQPSRARRARCTRCTNPSSSSTGSTSACSSIRSRAACSTPSRRATASTTRSRRPRIRCAICSNVSQWRSRSRSDEPETLRAHLMANTIGPARAACARGHATCRRRPCHVAEVAARRARARRASRATGKPFRRTAFELLGWLGEGTRGAGPA